MIGTVTDYGDQALLLQFDSTAEVLAWSDVLRDADLPGVVDIVPASRTVLIKLDGPRYQAPPGNGSASSDWHRKPSTKPPRRSTAASTS